MNTDNTNEEVCNETVSKINIPEIASAMSEEKRGYFESEGRAALIAIAVKDDGEGYETRVVSTGDTSKLPPDLGLAISLGVNLACQLINITIDKGSNVMKMHHKMCVMAGLGELVDAMDAGNSEEKGAL